MSHYFTPQLTTTDMRHFLPTAIMAFALLCTACQPSDSERANQRVEHVRTLVINNQLNQAKIEIDSIHILYPKEVAARRIAKHLNDSITYLEAQRTLTYSDSMLNVLLPQVDPLLKKFRYEKNDKYEDEGKYVHYLLKTTSNTSRCYIQCYVSDQRKTILKSYYFGTTPLQQERITLTSDGMSVEFTGSHHAFEAEGWHEILTLDEEHALQLLNFISAHRQGRIKVTLAGKSNYIYYLQANEKEALEQTYLLGTLMRDIRRLEENINIANKQIARYNEKNML